MQFIFRPASTFVIIFHFVCLRESLLSLLSSIFSIAILGENITGEKPILSVRWAIIADECGRHWFIIDKTFFLILISFVISVGDIGSSSAILAPNITSILNGPSSGIKVILSVITTEKWSLLRLGMFILWDTLRFNSTRFKASSFIDEDLLALICCR